MPDRLEATRKPIVGAKQTLKALERDGVSVVYVARDAEERVVRPVLELCRKKGVEVVYLDTMQALGRACRIDVGAAAAAIGAGDARHERGRGS